MRFARVIYCLAALTAGHVSAPGTASAEPASTMSDLSGLAWLKAGTFVAVHDIKNDRTEKTDKPKPRVSLVMLPKDNEGVTWREVTFNWPAPLGLSSDLESASRIPDTQSVLLVESGSKGPDGTVFRRIFLADFAADAPKITHSVDWPEPVRNVEGTAVAKLGNRLVFIFAEREGYPTVLRWAEVTPDLKFGAFKSAEIVISEPGGKDARPISALEVDNENRLYAVSTIDPGDQGPFRSIVWRIGRIEPDQNGAPRVTLTGPTPVALLDGLKVESLAFCPDCRRAQFFVGTDDEAFGGIVRPITLHTPPGRSERRR